MNLLPITIVPTPPSAVAGDAKYDDRLEQVARKVCAKLGNARYLSLLYGTANREPSHQSRGGKRSVKAIYDTIAVREELKGKIEKGTILTILDDVSTSGASFEAAYQRLSEAFPNAQIIVIVWAKAKNSAIISRPG